MLRKQMNGRYIVGTKRMDRNQHLLAQGNFEEQFTRIEEKQWPGNLGKEARMGQNPGAFPLRQLRRTAVTLPHGERSIGLATWGKWFAWDETRERFPYGGSGATLQFCFGSREGEKRSPNISIV